jgi:hypothetical protein
MRGFVTYSAAVAVAAIITGCSPALKTVTMTDLQKSLNETITQDGKRPVATRNITVTMDDYPLLKEVCDAKYAKASEYEFDGTMLRFKLNHYSYKVPLEKYPDSGIYVHNYAVCSSFFPLENGSKETQEVVTVRYIATSRSNYKDILTKIATIEGGYQGLMLNAGFHTGATVPTNGWASLNTTTFDKENLLYLKMEALNMKVINKYDGEKFDDILALEYVHANVTRSAEGALSFSPLRAAIIQDVFSVVPAKSDASAEGASAPSINPSTTPSTNPADKN